MLVRGADGHEEGAGDDAVGVEEDFLGPDGFGLGVQKVRDGAAERAEDDVHQPEHGGPVG